ncbi:PDDEXK nuclease domain-containing protein [Porphyromonas levii]|uniref:PDDEXK nuclease domain-containing protein n=1 Tax=Porphyromonas levii TaxID=28114 RepID=UPI00035E4BAB|nr:PDDEXK nuclease domain-containing protein [Porphyromonas levii]MBR8760525.1 putative nuclease YhcG [Porphyromonas levii]MBR8801942.1 putative nuclease YhcG [Porphyromonas levii]
MSNDIKNTDKQDFSPVVRAIGSDLEQTQVRVVASANADMLFHYWKVGHFILYLQKKEGWGSKVIDNLSKAIRSQYPDKKGYSARNLIYMCQFAKAYPMEVLMQLEETDKALLNPSVEEVLKQTKTLNEITQQPVALIQDTNNQTFEIVQQPVAQLGEVAQTLSSVYHTEIQQIEELFKRSAVVRTNWASHVILLNSKLPLGERYWYITQAVANGWSRNILQMQIETNLFARQITAKKVSNFSARLPKPQSDLANYLMKDPYIFDIMGQTDKMAEKDIEQQLVSHITKYLLEMGSGFAFVAQQKHFEVGDSDFYADLILYNIQLHAYVVIELKATPFKPEYMGQLNFYINVVDDTLRGEHDNKTIGLLLCNGGDKVVAQYALSGYEQPIGVSDYQLSKAIPENLKSALPTVEEVEEELNKIVDQE